MSERARQLWVCTNAEQLRCKVCEQILPYWTHSRDDHPCEHWPIVVDDPRDAPPGAGLAPLSDLPPKERQHVWNLSAQYRPAEAQDEEPGTWPEVDV